MFGGRESEAVKAQRVRRPSGCCSTALCPHASAIRPQLQFTRELKDFYRYHDLKKIEDVHKIISGYKIQELAIGLNQKYGAGACVLRGTANVCVRSRWAWLSI
jgi:hypothetical protein